MTLLQFIALPGIILAWAGLLPIDKIVFGLFRWHQNGKDYCWPDPERWAELLGCDLRTIRASVARLTEAGCLRTDIIDGRRVYSVLQAKDRFYLRVPVAVLLRHDLNPAERLGLALVAFNCQGSEDRHGWASHEKMSEWLGMGRRSVVRMMGKLKDAGLIAVRRRGPRSNQYALTPAGEVAIMAQQGGKRCANFARPSKEENKTSREAKEKAVLQTVSLIGLSGCRPVEAPESPEHRVFQRLLDHGVHRTVAASIVYHQRHGPASIDQAIDNALLRQAEHRQRGLDRLKPFNLAGYIVASLNGARREAGIVKPSRLFIAARARYERAKAIRSSPFVPLPEAVFEERRRRCLEQLRAAIG
jgi:hypothetical protein